MSSQVWSGLQTVGRATTYTRTASGVLTAICMMMVASSLGYAAVRDKHDDTAEGKLDNVSCNSQTSTDSKGISRTYYDCTGDASYAVEGVPYTKKFTYTGIPSAYSNGTSVPVYYNRANPADATSSRPPSGWLAIAGCIVCFFAAVLAIIWALFVKSNNTAAGLTGINDISRAFR